MTPVVYSSYFIISGPWQFVMNGAAPHLGTHRYNMIFPTLHFSVVLWLLLLLLLWPMLPSLLLLLWQRQCSNSGSKSSGGGGGIVAALEAIVRMFWFNFYITSKCAKCDIVAVDVVFVCLRLSAASSFTQAMRRALMMMFFVSLLLISVTIIDFLNKLMDCYSSTWRAILDGDGDDSNSLKKEKSNSKKISFK